MARAAAGQGTTVASDVEPDAGAEEKPKTDEAAQTKGAESKLLEKAAAVLPLKPAMKTEASGEPGAPAEQIGVVAPDGIAKDAEAKAGERIISEAGLDAVEAAAQEASEDDVVELESDTSGPVVEIIEPERAKAQGEPEAEVKEPPQFKKPGEKSAEAAKEEKVKEITTDKETDQLDRILASIRRITSAL